MKKYYTRLGVLPEKAKALLLANKKYTCMAGALAVLVLILAVAGIAGSSSDKSATPVVTPGVSASETGSVALISLEGDCLKDYTNWNDKDTYYPAKLTYTKGDQTFTADIQIKPQGTTSLYAPKKNFTVKFAEGITFVDKWGAQEKYVLKADYIDPTCSGNVVSARLAAEMNEKYGVFPDTPNYGVIDGFPIWVTINGEDAGIFNLTIPKDAWLFGMDESNPNHLVLACEGWSEASRMQSADIDYEADWSFEVGEPNETSKAAFERLVTFVSTADDETFVREFDRYLDLDACLNYICYINAAYAKDNVAKNMLMVTYDGKVWAPALYDLDSLWGVDAKGTGLMEADGAWSEKLLSDGNCLLYRVNYFFGDQVRERYRQLREGILSRDHILKSFESYAAQIPQECYDINNALWYGDGTRIRTLELMGQLMDAYLPVMDQNMAASSAAAPAPAVQPSAQPRDSAVRYVWETDGVQQSLEDMASLPVAAAVRYTLDGNEISARDLAGKSGQLEITLRAERRENAKAVYGVAAVMQLEDAQCRNITATGGTLAQSPENGIRICTGSAWLDSGNDVYEMRLRMDVTDFDPARYVVAVHPAYGAGDGDSRSLQALLSTAGELTAIVDDGVALHTSLTEWHTYLTNVNNTLTAANASARTLLPAEDTENANDILARLLADAEAEADALLQSAGYAPAANMTSEARVKLLSQAAGEEKRTEAEKAQASELLEQIEDYLAVAAHLQKTQQTAAELSGALETLSGTMPDIVGAYSYANDALYGLLYRISTLYQNIANYYASVGGDGSAWMNSGDWQDVILFANHDSIIP